MDSKSSLNKLLDDISLVKCLSFFIFIYLIITVISMIFSVTFDLLLFKVVLYGVMLLFFMITFRFPFKELKKEYKSLFDVVNFPNILLIVIANILFTSLIFFVLNYMSNLGLITFNSSLFGFLNLNNSVHVILYFITIVILSPIVEEILFRGILLRKLILDFKFNVKWVIILTSVLFGFCHSFGGILSAFLFGICMSIFYIKSRNIFVPILAHMINNLISFFLALSGIEFLIRFSGSIIFIIVMLSVITNFILFKNIFKEFLILNNFIDKF